MTLEQMLIAAGFNPRNLDRRFFNERHFPADPALYAAEGLELWPFRRSRSTRAAMAAIDADGFASEGLIRGLAYFAAHPRGERDDRTVIMFGAMVAIDGVKRVAYVGEDPPPIRRADPPSRLENEWMEDSWALVSRKK